jgi:hypothetical protein
LDEKWAAFFYESNVAFNVARHPAFVAAVKATSKAGFDYTPPSYHAMRTKHIEPKVKQVKAEIEKATKQSIALYGATICSDGWNNVIHRPLINVMLVCPVGDIFIGSVDTTGHKKTKKYMAEELRTYIEAIGPSNVTQIYSDNANTMLGALDNLVAMYPLLYKQGCSHSRPSPKRLGKRGNIQGPNNKGHAGMYLHPKPPCDNGIVSPLFT